VIVGLSHSERKANVMWMRMPLGRTTTSLFKHGDNIALQAPENRRGRAKTCRLPNPPRSAEYRSIYSQLGQEEEVGGVSDLGSTRVAKDDH
jgi:hypothetical protein